MNVCRGLFWLAQNTVEGSYQHANESLDSIN